MQRHENRHRRPKEISVKAGDHRIEPGEQAGGGDQVGEQVHALADGAHAAPSAGDAAPLLGVPIDEALAESVVKHIVSQRQKITVELIKKIVCKFYNVSPDEIVSRSRQQNLVRPRQMAIYLARRFTDSPLQAIGKTFNRYHATALHSIHSVEKGLKQDSAIRQQVDFLCQKLESGKL